MSTHVTHSRIPPYRQARVAIIAAAASSIAFIAAPTAAHAQRFAERFVARGELGAGTMISTYQRNTLGYGLDVQGSGRLGFTLFGPLALQASFSSWWFPSENAAGVHSDGQQLSVTGGLRFEPMISRVGRLFVDANAGLGMSGGRNRPTFDAGIGFEFALNRAVGLGPVARYGHLFASREANDAPSDAQYWSAGLSLSVRLPQAEPRVAARSVPVDSDRDGIFDVDDECPSEAAGSVPDAEHRGCPMRDRDQDGVMDVRDACPSEHQGEHPDPTRIGCPAVDTDRDGVFDHLDLCVTTPASPHPDPERAGCPDGDDDADDVFNHDDQCPREAQGLHADPARRGCPLADRDHDTVPDSTDACPDVVGAPSFIARRNGCPGLVVVRDGQIVILQPVFFATNRDRILRPSFRVLDAVVAALRAQPEIRRVGVEGHADDVGSDEANMSLSQRRAQAVVAWITQHGIEASRVEAHGYGATRPIVPNGSSSGRAANRRVEFHILDPRPNNSVDGIGSASSSAPGAR